MPPTLPAVAWIRNKWRLERALKLGTLALMTVCPLA